MESLNEVIDDEQILLSNLLEKKKILNTYGSIEMLTDGNSYAGFFYDTLKRVVDGERLFQININEISDHVKMRDEKKLVYVCLNCRDHRYFDKCYSYSAIKKINKYLSLTEYNADCRTLVMALVPLPDNIPYNITAVSEREYNSLIEKRNEEVDVYFYRQLENLCKDRIKEGDNLSLLRFDNIYGPGIDLIDDFSLESFIEESNKNKTINITGSDDERIISLIYVRDAARAGIHAISKAKSGHIYNVTGFRRTIKGIKRAFRDSFAEQFGEKSELPTSVNKTWQCFDNLKFRKTGWRVGIRFGESIYRTGLYFLNQEYMLGRKLSIYNGRLDIIKKLELDCLNTVDKICRENSIKYFLAGGSLLGAIRHHGFIPWDDDLDIGMLREDFEKFRKTCPSCLPERYTYESPQNESGSHYHFDKIRLKGTYFSTNYSRNFLINDGVFLDILVYDRTSRNKLLSDLHIKLLSMWTRVINVKWYNRLRKNVYYKSTKIALPIMRMIPFPFFHYFFEHLLRLYEKSNSPYLVDGLGQNIKKGRFLREWVNEIEYVDFEGLKAPIPTGYDGYLRHFYGEDYMRVLPISKRTSGHQLARIDLGEYLFDDSLPYPEKDLDIRGELFEVP